jgi:hypothetical protein
MREVLGGRFALLSVAILLGGCSRTPPGAPMADQVPVKGTITFPDKTPLKGGMIFFTPTDAQTGDGTLRFECADLVDANGHYTLGFNGDKAGAPPGEYKVYIQPRGYNELKNSNANRIPQKYREEGTTPLLVEVKDGENTLDFELK